MKHYWCRCSCHRLKVDPTQFRAVRSLTLYRRKLDRVGGVVGLFADTVPGCMVAYAIHPEQVGLWLFMGSEIQATLSFRTFHNAHTAGLGQQVKEYAL